jgi:aspartate/methionine/tyrosine aminotransferase
VINPLISAVAPPPIPEARAWAKRYDGRYGPAIDLTQAVPGYPAHPDLVRRLGEAAAAPASFSYGNITGDLALRESYAADVSALYDGKIQPDDVAITTGANMASFAITMLLARAGDAIMLPVPWYFNHQMNAAMLGVAVVPLPCRPEDGFVPDPAEAERRLTPAVRAIFLVTPNNPTGAIYPADTIAAFADLCRRRDLTLVSTRPTATSVRPGWRGRMICSARKAGGRPSCSSTRSRRAIACRASGPARS